MSYKKAIFTGTMVLTISGFLSRILGFYNRIFLADLIGAQELGIYQLILPVYMLCFTLVCHGFETGISNLTSRFEACGETANIRRLLKASCVLSISLALILCLFLRVCAENLCSLFHIPGGTEGLRIAALALPFVAVKSCIHGYYIGLHRSAVSACSQLLEQLARVSTIYLLSITIYTKTADATLAVWGMVAGEIISALYTIIACIYSMYIHPHFSKRRLSPYHLTNGRALPLSQILGSFFSFSIPLTINHFCITVVNSAESLLIPFVLTRYCGSHEQALTIYGTLTGMALPFLFFPATITNSMSVMLLPAVSAAYKQKKMVQLRNTISICLHYSIVIGIFSTFAFLLYGNALGETIFHSTQAGEFIHLFAVLCPFMYLVQTTSSILNGFGCSRETLYHSLLSVAVRIAFILFAVPIIGIPGYLLGLLTGYLLQIFLNLICLLKITAFPFSVEKTLLLPATLAFSGGWASEQLFVFFSQHLTCPPLLLLAICGCSYFVLFAVCQLLLERLTE